MKAKPIGVIRTNGCPKSGEPKQEIPVPMTATELLRFRKDQEKPLRWMETVHRISKGVASQLQGLLMETGRALPSLTGMEHRRMQVAAETAERYRKMQDQVMAKAIGIPSTQAMMRDLAAYGMTATTAQMAQEQMALKIRPLALEMWRNTKLQVALILNPKVLEGLPVKDRLRAIRQIRTLNRKLMQAQGWTLEPWADPATWPPGRRLP